MQEDFEKGTPEAHDEGAINPETGVGPREVLKSFGFRGSAELYIALRELVPAGSLSTAMYIGVCAWYGLFYCRLCGDRLPGDRPKRIVDRWCDDCYTIISAEDVRNLVEAMLPPGSKPARSERDPDPWPESMYKPVGEKKPLATIFRDRQQNQMETKAWKARSEELRQETEAAGDGERVDQNAGKPAEPEPEDDRP